jgi:CheY-like chemotaxis protein
LYEAHWPEIKLVLLDYFMQTLRGDEVFERLQRINPDVRVILTSASEEDISQTMRHSPICGFVQKPPSPRDLIRQVRHALNRHAPPHPRA